MFHFLKFQRTWENEPKWLNYQTQMVVCALWSSLLAYSLKLKEVKNDARAKIIEIKPYKYFEKHLYSIQFRTKENHVPSVV